MCDIVSVTIDFHMEWLTYLSHILKATPPTRIKYITLEDLTEALNFTLNTFSVL